MSVSDRWLLPDGIEELLPQEAKRVEAYRASLFRLYDSWGYELVITPLVEYLESLSVGIGSDLESHTFKLVDQLSGRMLAVRSDITPQVARIDAHRLNRQGPSRLCYWGPVLLTHARELGGTRSPIQVGAELYGHDGVESDIEVLSLMLDSLRIVGLSDACLDLGHVGIFKALAQQAKLDAEMEEQLFDALQRKAAPEVTELLDGLSDKNVASMLNSLVELNGDERVITAARTSLAKASADVHQALDALEHIIKAIKAGYPGLNLHVDLAELRGYSYHTGVVFAAYTPGSGQSIAQGGRYDSVGAVFGRARPATGFSLDLRSVLAISDAGGDDSDGIFAPAKGDAALKEKIAELRTTGERVICELPGQGQGAAEMGCDRHLVQRDGKWLVESL